MFQNFAYPNTPPTTTTTTPMFTNFSSFAFLSLKFFNKFWRLLLGKFDIVIDDGRARVAVAKWALENKVLKDNLSLLLIHDWQREYYKDIVNVLGYR